MTIDPACASLVLTPEEELRADRTIGNSDLRDGSALPVEVVHREVHAIGHRAEFALLASQARDLLQILDHPHGRGTLSASTCGSKR
jgi:hypothetical protein